MMNEILDALKEIEKRLDDMGPVATELWFVDRPAMYDAFIQNLPELNSDAQNIFGWQGVKVFNARSADVFKMPVERRMATRVFQALPGVWALMSDGTVRWLDTQQQEPT